jgi:hypothetical protein
MGQRAGHRKQLHQRPDELLAVLSVQFFAVLPFRLPHLVQRNAVAERQLLAGEWVQQSEDFNGYKSEAVLLTFKPRKSWSWNLNYYTGFENRDTVPILNPGIPVLPTQPGYPPSH